MTNYLHALALVIPETIVVVTALVVLVSDFTLRELTARFRFIIGGMIGGIGCLAAIIWMVIAPEPVSGPGAMVVADSLTQFVKIALLGLTIFTIVLSMDSDFTTHAGEYIALILLAAVGMMLLAGSDDILMIFISLELTSLSLYILTAFNKRSVKSSEAALKYFLFGGMSAAFTLFGLSLIYGVSGATNLPEISRALAGKGLDSLLIVAMVMVVIGFGFKIAAVPFHLWAPDTYQGAPTPSAALIASGSKVASFFIFARVMTVGFAGVEGSGVFAQFAAGWVPLLAVVAGLSMVLGNLAAIAQTSVKRLLAYSAIAHAGYLLLAIMSHSTQGLASLIYYAVTYGLTTVGAFGVVGVVEQSTGGEQFSNFAGLSRRAPVLSFCMLIFMLSLAGIPPLAGFFGKFYVFVAAVNNGARDLGLIWLVILAVAMSAVSLYYYLQVLKQIYVSDGQAGVSTVPVPVISQVVICLLAFGVILFGCVPGLILNWVQHALEKTGL